MIARGTKIYSASCHCGSVRFNSGCVQDLDVLSLDVDVIDGRT